MSMDKKFNFESKNGTLKDSSKKVTTWERESISKKRENEGARRRKLKEKNIHASSELTLSGYYVLEKSSEKLLEKSPSNGPNAFFYHKPL